MVEFNLTFIMILKCFSQILCGRSAEKNKTFVVSYLFGGKLMKNKDSRSRVATCKDLFIWTELPII